MDIDWFSKLIFLLITLIFSALFSGSEVALFSLDKKHLKELKEGKSLLNRYILSLLESPRRLLVTILIGNTIFNVAASIFAVTLAIQFAEVYDLSVELVLLAQIVLLTIFLLLIGEITPKLFASKNPLLFSKIIAFPLYWISILIYPVAKILTDAIKFIVSKFKIDRSKTALHPSEITDLVDIGKEHGSIEEEEHELIHGLVEFRSINVREVMTPRVDIIAVPSDAEYDEVIDLITESGHSRIPVYEEDLDDIIGVLYAKDILSFLDKRKGKDSFALKKIVRDVIFIPETKLIHELLREFQKENIHMGIIVDEYGGTSGLVSLEDILEEIVGEIQDEYDKEEKEIIKVDDDKYVVLGKVSIDELNELFEKDFTNENDDYDTVGGFIFYHAGKIPKNGYQFDYKGLNFKVVDVENKRVNKIIVEKLHTEEDEQ
ncbi:MAG: HlyC/CorC family transporter [Chlorobi bacterium]|nr:HlyC/CorC family transporter [Chlorobiota bacterium]